MTMMSWTSRHASCVRARVAAALASPLPLVVVVLLLLLLLSCVGAADAGTSAALAAGVHDVQAIQKENASCKLWAIQQAPGSQPSDDWEELLQRVVEQMDVAVSKLQRDPTAACDLVLFPEAVLWGQALPFRPAVFNLSTPFHNGTNPCTTSTQQKQVGFNLPRQLSCLAHRQHVYLAASVVDRVPCNQHSDAAACPDDGVYLYNTLVVFAPSGQLIAKYHKAHIFGTDSAMNQAPPQPVTFFVPEISTTIGILICYDMEFQQPSQAVLKDTDIILAASEWINDPPLFTAVMYQQAWSEAHNATLAVANRADNGYVAGGGIYSRGLRINSTENTAPCRAAEGRLGSAGCTLQPVAIPVSTLLPVTTAHAGGETNKITDTWFPFDCSVHEVPDFTPPAGGDETRVRSPVLRLNHTFRGNGTTCHITGTIINITTFAAAHDSAHRPRPPSSPASTRLNQRNTILVTAFSQHHGEDFPHTPDTLHVESCGVTLCIPSGTETADSARIHCQRQWAGGNTGIIFDARDPLRITHTRTAWPGPDPIPEALVLMANPYGVPPPSLRDAADIERDSGSDDEAVVRVTTHTRDPMAMIATFRTW
ncbi:hypothetical protein PTSG_03340 [Salpingoeca rosetta]|uniref:CN hydrolase domain-containing protein n=1 Tax=Salpingoeca rosetta (strain ATCC 50818 / BSB-021) TaxID=946362 RepID=F2U4W3_SALR5|nr:uncharacterized protein PTSG_03340 [Salpingoeca rosetta]EGD82679.1 hypothetical protein PTSG_03340 [Salpingoeca rosetta]|eukprot:XP_004995915.1 hypothetical protein PTSG_03340 [Salpingoeca rosetta]